MDGLQLQWLLHPKVVELGETSAAFAEKSSKIAAERAGSDGWLAGRACVGKRGRRGELAKRRHAWIDQFARNLVGHDVELVSWLGCFKVCFGEEELFDRGRSDGEKEFVGKFSGGDGNGSQDDKDEDMQAKAGGADGKSPHACATRYRTSTHCNGADRARLGMIGASASVATSRDIDRRNFKIRSGNVFPFRRRIFGEFWS